MLLFVTLEPAVPAQTSHSSCLGTWGSVCACTM